MRRPSPGPGEPTAAGSRQLVVNADDFGMSHGVNRGIIEAHATGLLTSTSLMVRWSGVEEAVRLARAHPRLGLGLHIDLGAWTYEQNEWHTTYEVVDTADGAAVRAEVERQLARFERLAGRSPDHLNSHHHVHREEPAATAVLAAGERLRIPVRGFAPAIRYCGEFYGQSSTGQPFHDAIGVDALLEVLRRLERGTTELCCHPGYADGLDSTYATERELELRALCDPRVAAAVRREQIQLCRFADLRTGSARGDG